MREKVFFFDVDYTFEGEKGIIIISGLNEKNEKIFIRKNFSHYFFVLPKPNKEQALKEKIDSWKNFPTKVKTEIVKKRWMNLERNVIKVVVENPRKLKDVRDVIKNFEEVEDTFEYNISFYKRFLIDFSLKPCSWIEVEIEKVGSFFQANEIKQINEIIEPELNILAFDTEWVEMNGKEKLIMISIYSKNIKKVLTIGNWEEKQEFVESFSNEKAMIKRFWEIIENENPDFIVSYNGDAFDFLKLKEKLKEIGIKFDLEFVRRGGVSAAKLPNIVHLDLFSFISNILSPTLKTEILTLDEVANELIGERKIELEYKEIVELWKNRKDLGRIAEYSMRDAYLTYSLSQIILPQIFSISRLTGELPFDVCRYSYSQLVEAYLIRKAFEDNVLIPNSPKHEEKEMRMRTLPYKGAIVVEPKKGIHENIAVVDFRSLYPSIITTKNISVETFNCAHEECKEKNSVPETNYHFCIKIEGFIPKHLKFLIEERKRIKEKMKKLNKESREYKILNNEQYATKIIANAVYGYYAFIGARWYKKECAEATAAFGRYYIKKVLEMAKQHGFEILYGDTDSVFLFMNIDLDNLMKKAIDFVNKVNENLPGIIELEFRGVYKRGIFVAREKGEVGAKKRYALLDINDNLEVRGFEAVRRDWCKLAKIVQRKVLEFILKDKDPQKAISYVREVIKNLREKNVKIEDLIIYEQITKPLSEYEQISPHVKAAMRAKEMGIEIAEGSVIGFIIKKGGGSISDRAYPVELIGEGEYDPEYYINHQILPASLRVLKALDYTEKDILIGEAGLKKFFKW